MSINKEPLVPTVKPDGMSQEDFEIQLKEDINLHDQWLYQNIDILQKQTEEDMWRAVMEDERERLTTDNVFKNIYPNEHKF